MTQHVKKAVVVGGGLGGLFCAALLAREGVEVEVLEAATRLGGRAQTDDHEGFKLNIGPHALYVKGAARRLLEELKVPYGGHLPAARGLRAVCGGEIHLLPAGPVSLMKTSLLGFRDKLETGKLLGVLPKVDATRWRGRSVREWVDAQTDSARLRQLLEALARLSTYSNDPYHQDAGAFLAQLQLALEANVLYIDGGWQVLVDGLVAAIEREGGGVRSGVRVASLRGEKRLDGVMTGAGETIAAEAVVLAVEPAACSRLVGDRSPALAAAVEGLRPVRAACLDLALSSTPHPDRPFALGIDEPYYLSVHSATADLAPPGGSLIQVARYLSPDEAADRETRARQLEGFADLIQPGWRDVVVHRRLMPAMTVTHTGCLRDRPRPGTRVADVQGLWLAGDWVGEHGMLADAAAASAGEVAEAIVADRAAKKVA